MRITQTKPLFAWDCLEDSPTLKTIRDLLAAIPDGPLLETLRAARGNPSGFCSRCPSGRVTIATTAAPA